MISEVKPKLDSWVDYHDWSYASSQEARKLFEKALNERGVDDFTKTPAGREFQSRFNYGPVRELNANKILQWLADNNVPGTVKNLIWVFETLKRDGSSMKPLSPSSNPPSSFVNTRPRLPQRSRKRQWSH